MRQDTRQIIDDPHDVESEVDEMIDYEEPDDFSRTENFHENLAEQMDEGYLDRLAQRVHEWVDADEASRSDWQEREARGIRLLGVTDKVEGGADFEGASRSVHPMLALAMTQFQSRAIKELWPAGGPVKTVVLGEKTNERAQQAERVEGYLNYLYTRLMPGAFVELDRLLQRLPMSGSVFKRVYFCPVEREVVARQVEPSRVYVPYRATDLRSAPRFTYEWDETQNETRRLQYDGFYLGEERARLQRPFASGDDLNATEAAIDDAVGQVSVEADDEDSVYKRYECACFLDLPGFEDEGDDGESTGIALPYLVTVDKDSQRTLRIARNWAPDDALKRRRVHLIHYYFTPGFGFFGWGLFHLIGGLSSVATGALRALLDAAFLENTKGGFIARDVAMRMGKTKIEMGRWNEVDALPEEVATAFHEFRYSPPSETLVKLLDLVQTLGGQLGSTTDNLLGDANNNAPVGTTLALIEQGLEPISAVHQRLHVSQCEEFRLVAELVAENMPDEYPYAVPGANRMVMASDFDARVDVLPVSDPSTVTNTQRITRAQSVVQLADSAPDLYDRRQAHKDMLEVMRVPNADELIPADDAEIPRREPVAEGMALLVGQPVQVFPDQDHAAHLVVHGAWWASIPEEMRERLAASYQAHDAEHRAQLYRSEMARRMGVDLPMPGEELPPEVEAQLAQAAAMAAESGGAVSMPMAEAPAAGDDGEANAKAAADIGRKNAQAEADIARKDRSAQAEIERRAADDIARDLVEAAHTRGAMADMGIDEAPMGGAGLGDAGRRYERR